MQKKEKNKPKSADINIIRTDYLVNKRVIIATARAKRPDNFAGQKEKISPKKTCPFCPHNEAQVHVLEDVVDAQGQWQLRAIQNVFGILVPQGNPPEIHARNGLLNEANAYGFCEVIIDTPKHNVQLEELSEKDISDWLAFLITRVKKLQYTPGVRHISVFKNRGAKAGASIAHSHTQIITTPHIPRDIKELREAHNQYLARHARSPYEEVFLKERNSERFIYEDEHVFVLAPFASEVPLEVWIFPKRHIASMVSLRSEEREAMAYALRKIFSQLNTLGAVPYNLLFITDKEHGSLHFHLRLHPRFTNEAGFEQITGLHVNPTLPEDAAKFYRQAWRN